LHRGSRSNIGGQRRFVRYKEQFTPTDPQLAWTGGLSEEGGRLPLPGARRRL
jgi:hypothetical protein